MNDLASLTDREIAEWIVATCLTFGTTTATAYKVAGLFVEGIRPDAAAETKEIWRCSETM